MAEIDDGGTGLLIPPNDPRALASALDKLLQDEQLRIAMGRRGRERYLALFEFEAFYVKIHELYKKVIGRSSKNGRSH